MARDNIRDNIRDDIPDPSRTIADLRRELSQCRAERDAALARETATAEVLQVINAAPGDLAPVFDAILEKAMLLCEAAFGTLLTYDGELFHAAAHRGLPAELVETLRQPGRATPGGSFARLVGGETVVHLADIADDDAYRLGLRGRVAMVDIGGARTAIWIALRKDDALLGTLVIYRQEVRPFSDKQIALLENFAAQAVIAMENARLITETREALEQQTATAEVLGVINSSPGDLAPVFDAMLEKAARLCETAFGVFHSFDGEAFHTIALRGAPPALVEFYRQPFRPAPGSFAERVIQGAAIVSADDLSQDEIYRSGPGARAVVDLGGGRSFVGIALRKDDKLLGAFWMYRREVRPFSDKQIALLQNFAAQAVIAMENARLITETREALEQQTATAEVLGVINSSPGDLAPVFDAMLEKAMDLCGAAFGALMSYDGETVSAVATRGLPPELSDVFRTPVAPRRDGDAPYARFLRGESLLHIVDMAADDVLPSLASRPRALVDIGGARTGLEIPLRKEEALRGSIWLYRQEVRPFTDKQIALLQNFAVQAVIAMENARLITETREALEQQTATAEVLGIINASPGDLAPVFDAILDKGLRLCEAAFGTLWTFDGECFHAVALHRVPAGFAELLTHAPYRPEPGSGHERLLRGASYFQIDDAAAQTNIGPVRRALVELGGARTVIAVPLRKEETILGAISAYRQEVRPFSDKQIALLQNFAAQAVIAMENARLITETREALEQQTATAEVLGVINSSPGDIKPVFDAILEKAHKLCGAAFGGLLTYDGEAFHVVATHNLPRAFAELTSRPFGVGPDNPFSRLIRGERLVHIPDLAELTATSPDDPMLRGAVELGGVRTILQMPLRRDNNFLGVITAYRQEVQPFTEQQIALLENFAAQAVIAMENARLITETREALEQQTATAEVLGVINSSPGDLVPVFDAMLEKAMRLCEADFGALCLFGSQGFRVAATRGFPATLNDFLRGELPVHPGSVPDRVRHGERVIHIPDLTIAEAAARTPVFNAMIDLGGARSTVWVDLRKDDRAAGFFAIYRQEVSPFTDKQIALLQNFAAQAVIAMENARLLGELRERNDEIAGWNKELEARVAAQLAEIERTGKLRRFLAPQLAELIVAQGDESILESHRREIVVVFCDVRGFTGFAERAEPEEVMAFLRDYHAALGPVVARFEGTLDHYSGDGIMVFFNDPLPTPEPVKRAIAMAVAMREAAQQVLAAWRRHGHAVGFGAGISQGYATLGQIGFAERMDYTAIGTVCNLAARLCDEAKDGQILISRRVAVAVEDEVNLEEIGEVSLKGLSQPVAVYNVG